MKCSCSLLDHQHDTYLTHALAPTAAPSSALPFLPITSPSYPASLSPPPVFFASHVDHNNDPSTVLMADPFDVFGPDSDEEGEYGGDQGSAAPSSTTLQYVSQAASKSSSAAAIGGVGPSNLRPSIDPSSPISPGSSTSLPPSSYEDVSVPLPPLFPAPLYCRNMILSTTR